jgi:hypothetical protein
VHTRDLQEAGWIRLDILKRGVELLGIKVKEPHELNKVRRIYMSKKRKKPV